MVYTCLDYLLVWVLCLVFLLSLCVFHPCIPPLQRITLHALPSLLQTPIWATNTRGKRDRYPDVAGDAPVHYPEEWYGAGYQAARALQWRILDRSGITTQLRNYRQSIGLSRDAVMTDDYHYMPFVNDEFNNVLLNMICPL